MNYSSRSYGRWLLSGLLLAAVGCSDQDTQTLKSGIVIGDDGRIAPAPASVEFSYPADGQLQVAPVAELVLRFTHAVDDNDLANKIQLENSQQQSVGFDIEMLDDGKVLKLIPNDDLALAEQYQLSFIEPLQAGERLVDNPNAFGAPGIQFTTRMATKGPLSLASLDDTFAVEELSPDGDNFTVVDNSSFRFLMTQPIDPQSIRYGDTVKLLDSRDQLVPATVMVKNQLLSIDPCLIAGEESATPILCGGQQDKLQAGERYRLQLDGVTSIAGVRTSTGTSGLTFEKEFEVFGTAPSTILVQNVVDSEQSLLSRLNGNLINGVRLKSVLQGVSDISNFSGTLRLELPNTDLFPDPQPVPLRVARGGTLIGTPFDVDVNGLIPVLDASDGTQQRTGAIKVTLVNDANGYLFLNPYTDNSDAARHVRLFMDVAMNTEEAQPNASLSQDFLRLELVGLATVIDGELEIDALTVAEPDLIGLEVTSANFAFKIRAKIADASTIPAPEAKPAPTLVSWTPGAEDAIPASRQAMHRPGDSVVLFFDQPLRRVPFEQLVQVFEDGAPLSSAELRHQIDGTTLTINRQGGFKSGSRYQIDLLEGIQNTEGTSTTEQQLEFTMTNSLQPSGVPVVSPLALTVSPGYPCVTDVSLSDILPTDNSLAQHGRCLVSEDSPNPGPQLPVTELPADRPIVVMFSQPMSLPSIELGESILIEKLNLDGTFDVVDGRIEKEMQRIKIFPDQAWQPGEIYRYTLRSAASSNVANTLCETESIICGVNGQPLQTDLLVDTTDFGGPDLVIYFRAIEPQGGVFNPLRSLPNQDANANFVIDCDDPCLEPFVAEMDGAGGFKTPESAAKLEVINQQANLLGSTVAIPARVGCDPLGADCPESKFILQTYNLDTEIVGPTLDPDTGQPAVLVYLYPTMLAASTTSVFLPVIGPQVTGTQVIRMQYREPSPGNPLGLIPGYIVSDEEGRTRFKTKVDLTLDAPQLGLPDGGIVLAHNLYGLPFTADLIGDVTFLDDGRLQIEQRNINAPELTVRVVADLGQPLPVIGDLLDAVLDGVEVVLSTVTEVLDPATCAISEIPLLGVLTSVLCTENESDSVTEITIPLQIPSEGLFINFVSFPVKPSPESVN